MSIVIKLSGFLFLFIIITNILSGIFGYKTLGNLNAKTQLQKVTNSPRNFKISVVLILIEHLSIISLAITLFIAFNSYNLILGFVWCISRIVEALVQIYDKKNYWGLLNIAKQYSDTPDTEKDGLIDLTNSILNTKTARFSFAQMLFSVGTFAYSLLFVIYGVEPILIGWFGIIASILYGLGNGISHIKRNFKILWNVGGLLILFFELVLGGWLFFF